MSMDPTFKCCATKHRLQAWILIPWILIPFIYLLTFYLNQNVGTSFHQVDSSETTYKGPWRHSGLKNNAVNTDLVPHQTYFDSRVQNSHSNAIVVSVSVLAKYRTQIVGCEVDGVVNKEPVIENVLLQSVIYKLRPVTHVDCFVYCYDMKVRAGSEVSLLYKKSGTVVRVPARSEVVIPSYEKEEEDGVMVCATGFGRVPYLEQWLTYQRTIGVQLIHIVVSPSFMVNLENSSVLQNYTSSGFVSLVVWDDLLNKSQVFYNSQSLKYEDCVLRYQGKYKYMMVIDFDEYFVPLGKTKDILSYIRNLIKYNIGSVILSRHKFCMSDRSSNSSEMPEDGNLTKLYNAPNPAYSDMGKSIHLVKVVLQNSVHRASLFSPYIRLTDHKENSARSAQCYFAHLKCCSRHLRRRVRVKPVYI